MVKLFILFLCSLLLLSGCVDTAEPVIPEKAKMVQTNQRNMFKRISPVEAKTLIEINQNNLDFVILDVRTPQEFETGYLENAQNIDFYAPDFKRKIEQLDKTKVYAIYCRSGHRSRETVKLMEDLRFESVYDLGGIMALKSLGLAIVN